MMDNLSQAYADLLDGVYDCPDRIVLNAYFRKGHIPGGFCLWWRDLHGSDENLDNEHLMRMAGRFSRRIRAYGQKHGIPIIDCKPGVRKHQIAQEHVPQDPEFKGLFLVLVARASRPDHAYRLPALWLFAGRPLVDCQRSPGAAGGRLAPVFT